MNVSDSMGIIIFYEFITTPQKMKFAIRGGGMMNGETL